MTVPTDYRTVYIANGSQTDYLVPQNYIRKSFLTVTLDEVATAAFTFLDDSTIRFDTAPTAGVEIVIERNTPRDVPIHEFSNITPFTGLQLNENFNQALQASQEIEFTESLAIQAAEDATNALATSQAALDQIEDVVDATLADGSVTTIKLADDAVTTAKVADAAIVLPPWLRMQSPRPRFYRELSPP